MFVPTWIIIVLVVLYILRTLAKIRNARSWFKVLKGSGIKTAFIEFLKNFNSSGTIKVTITSEDEEVETAENE